MTTSRGIRVGQPSDLPEEQQARAKLSTSPTKILVDLMVEQVQKGGKENNTIGRKEWSFLCDEFNKKTGLAWEKEQLKNRCAILKKDYDIVKSTLDLDDSVFQESTGIVEAAAEAWARYIRKNPDVEFIRTYGYPMFKELCIIFGKSDHSNAHKTDDKCSFSEHLSTQTDDSWADSDEADEVAGGRKTSQPSMPTSSNLGESSGRMLVEDSMVGGILEMIDALGQWAEAVQQCNAKYSIANCIRELDTIQGLQDNVYFAALELFYEPNARETFLSLREDKRYIWLCQKYKAAPTPRLIQRV